MLFACILLTGARDHVEAPRQVALDVAQRFSPRIAWAGPDSLVVDLEGLQRLFGDARAIGEEMRRGMAASGLEVRIAIAGTRMAARLVTHARAGLTLVPAGEEAATLAPLPIALLQHILLMPDDAGDMAAASSAPRTNGRAGARAHGPGAPAPSQPPRPPARFYRTSPVQEIVRPRRRRVPGMRTAAEAAVGDWLAMFRRWGLRTLGDLAMLPAGELAARLGSDGPALQALARGEDPAPLVPLADEERFEETLPLEWPIEGLEPLSFVLGRLFDPVCAQLERRGRAAAVLHVELALVTRTRWARRLELPAPMKDPRTLRTLALLDLESNPPPAAIDAVTVRVDPTPARTLQHSLLERARPAPEQMATLTARLGALMGERRIGRPVLLDAHRPDAFRLDTFTGHDGTPAAARTREATAGMGGMRPEEATLAARVEVDQGRPIAVRVPAGDIAGGAVERVAGPWRVSGDWWTSAQAWDHDEWDVALAGGTVCRLVRDRRRDRWYLEGIYD